MNFGIIRNYWANFWVNADRAGWMFTQETRAEMTFFLGEA